MAIYKCWLEVFGEMVGVEGMLVALQSLLAIKKGTNPFQFPNEWAVFKVSTTTPSIRSALVWKQKKIK
jgi:hypothetical protein